MVMQHDHLVIDTIAANRLRNVCMCMFITDMHTLAWRGPAGHVNHWEARGGALPLAWASQLTRRGE